MIVYEAKIVKQNNYYKLPECEHEEFGEALFVALFQARMVTFDQAIHYDGDGRRRMALKQFFEGVVGFGHAEYEWNLRIDHFFRFRC